MRKRFERERRCGQIRKLVEENKYTKALEQMDEIPLEEVDSIEDLYLFAEMYEKAERMNMTEKIFYEIYKRTHSRHALYRLLRLVIRLGDLEQAKELFLAYEVNFGINLDTFELRYRLAKALGEPRSALISILEDLKQEEYTEEWGYQLALLYEREGKREECIRECNDLKLWFGSGSLVDKAMALKERCEAPDWEPPQEESIPEPVEPDLEEEVVYAAAPVAIAEVEEDILPEQPIEKEVLEIPEEEPVSPLEMATPEQPEVLLQEEEMPSEIPAYVPEGISEPVVVKKNPVPQRPKLKTKEEIQELLEEEAEDVSERGIRYLTLKSAINHVKYSEGPANFVFAGGEERITLAVAKRVTKELNNVGHLSAKSIVKITAEKLNQLDLSAQIEKLLGGCLLIVDAPELTKSAVEELQEIMAVQGDKIVMMMSGPFDEMDCFLSMYPKLEKTMNYKIRM